MPFDLDKRNTLAKEDKSRKGSIDEPVKPLCNLLNSHPDHYTTSSCSGRIAIYDIPASLNKRETRKLFDTHGTAAASDIAQALRGTSADSLWLRQEGLILHIRCRTLAAAETLLRLAQNAGFKRSGIIATRESFSVEICSTENVNHLLARSGTPLWTDEILRAITDECNARQERNLAKLHALEAACRAALTQ